MTKEEAAKEEAEKELATLLSKWEENTFCPLIKAFCNTECVCFESGSISDRLTNGKFIINKPYCGNAMFFGN